MLDFLFALTGFFRYLLRFQSYEAKCVQLGCRPLCTQILPGQGRPHQPQCNSWHQKTRDIGLSDGEDRISLRSLVYHSSYRWSARVTSKSPKVWLKECFLSKSQYRSVTDEQRTDGQTDGRTDMP